MSGRVFIQHSKEPGGFADFEVSSYSVVRLEFAGLSRAACRPRKVRTSQDTVAANGCPPRGADQSNRDEPIEFGGNGQSLREATLNRQPMTLSGEAAGKWLEPGREAGTR